MAAKKNPEKDAKPEKKDPFVVCGKCGRKYLEAIGACPKC